MKIALGINDNAISSTGKFSENEILAAKRGDWEVRNRIINQMASLINSMARARTNDPEEQKKLVEAGKQGVRKAILKYKAGGRADHFQVYVVEFIEKRMNAANRKPGLLGRLFGN